MRAKEGQTAAGSHRIKEEDLIEKEGGKRKLNEVGRVQNLT
jgi:hypothetical protein